MLRDYQLQLSKDGLTILRLFHILYLAMEVRTGKTITALHIANEYGAKRVLFLTKMKALGSINSDFEKLRPSFDLYATNYEQLHNVSGSFDLIILDEAHSLGQYPKPAGKVKKLKDLCAGKPIIYLSGTPTPESFSQIYHQLFVSSFSPFKVYTSFYKWAKDFVYVSQRRLSHGIVNDYSKANKVRIDECIHHLFLSFSQAEAGFTGMVEEQVLTVKMQPTTYGLANVLKRKRVHVGNSGKEIIADTEVKLMNKLHQVYSGTVICEDKTAVAFDDTKALFIADTFKGKKIAVFYKFKAELDLLHKVFNGAITDSPEVFKERKDLVFVSQIQSGREGINLSTAEALVMYNIDFSAVSYWQARARLQTKDRATAAPLYWIFSEGGIESKIYEAVKNKQDYTLSYFRKDYSIEPIKKIA